MESVKDMEVTKDIKMELMKYFGCENDKEVVNIYFNSKSSDNLFRFYYYCKQNNLTIEDADRYYNLYGCINNHVSIDDFKKINDYLLNYENYDLRDLEGTREDKKLIRNTLKQLKIKISLKNWIYFDEDD